MNLVDCGAFAVRDIPLNEYELSMRLSTEKGFRNEDIERNFERLQKEISCRYLYARTFVKRLENGGLDLGFGEFKSETLLKNLKDSKEVFVFAVTLGIGVDRLLNKLSKISLTDYFITDAIASALAEGAANEVDRRIKGEVLCRPRFSPGFGDLSLEIQPGLLNFLNAQKILGISVGKSYLMAPMKTVTAIMGIIE